MKKFFVVIIFFIINLSSQTITVTSPNGSEQYFNTSEMNITWTGGDSLSVRIDLYKYDELLYNISSEEENSGNYTCYLPAMLIGEYFKIKISDSNGNYDFSDDYFSVKSYLDQYNDLKIHQVLTYDWDNGNWEDYPNKKIFYYLENGEIDHVDTLTYSYSNSSYFAPKIFNCTYDSLNYLLRYYDEYHYDDGSVWVDRVTTEEYKYDLDEKILNYEMDEDYDWFDGYTHEHRTKTYTYTNDKLMTFRHLYNYYDPYGSHGQYYDYTIFYTYDQYNRLLSEDTSNDSVDITLWEYDQNRTARAELNERLVKLQAYGYFGELTRIEYYDVNGDLDEVDSLIYLDGCLLQGIIKFEYDSDQDLLLEKQKIIYEYSNYHSGVEETNIVSDHILHQNYPNPFNPCTNIWYTLKKTSDINLSIFNYKGELVQTLFDGMKSKGEHTVKFDASKLNSGVYFYKLTTDEKTETRKMLLLK